MRRVLVPLVLLAVALPTAASAKPKVVSCYEQHGLVLKDTVNCVHPIMPKGQGLPWPVHCVTDNTSTDPVYVEGYWLVTCIAPIIP